MVSNIPFHTFHLTCVADSVDTTEVPCDGELKLFVQSGVIRPFSTGVSDGRKVLFHAYVNCLSSFCFQLIVIQMSGIMFNLLQLTVTDLVHLLSL